MIESSIFLEFSAIYSEVLGDVDAVGHNNQPLCPNQSQYHGEHLEGQGYIVVQLSLMLSCNCLFFEVYWHSSHTHIKSQGLCMQFEGGS